MKKAIKWMSISLIIALVAAFAVTAAFAAENTSEFAGGEGTAENPYLISTKEHLNNVRNYLGAHFKMTADIVFAVEDFAEGGAFHNEGVGWLPIGNGHREFHGVFDGNGHAIVGLRNDSFDWGWDWGGLFGYITHATIKNLCMANSNICGGCAGGIVGFAGDSEIINCQNTGNISGIDFAGGIVGYADRSEIINCQSAGDNVGEMYDAGGIVGYAEQSEITNCQNTGNVRGMRYAGGIAGLSLGNISDCYNAGSVIGDSDAGGIAGICMTIINCHNSGSVSGKFATGGIAAKTSGGEISNCYNSGSVSGKYDVGGIVGDDALSPYGETLLLRNCHNSGNISGEDAGGIAGNFGGEISNCYNSGEISGESDVGGIAAKTSGGEISNCYNRGEISVSKYSSSQCAGGIAGSSSSNTSIINCYYYDNVDKGVGFGNDTATKCSYAQLRAQSTFVGFDFTNVWVMRSYPELRDLPGISTISGQQSISIAPPKKNGIPQLTTSGASQYAVVIAWDGNLDKFVGGTVYTATVTLVPKTGFKFSTYATAKVADAEAVSNLSVAANGSSLTFKVKFAATEAREFAGIEIAESPAILQYTHGDTLSPVGMAVTALYDDDTSEDVTASAVVGYSNGRFLKKGDTSVQVSYNGATTSLVGLTVEAKTLRITGLTARNRQYNGSTSVVLLGGELVGVIDGDEVDVEIPRTGVIDSPDVGFGKVVSIVKPSLYGPDADCYTLADIDEITVDIRILQISPEVTLTGWIFGSTANKPVVLGNIFNADVTYEYKLAADADSAYTSRVPTSAGTYTVKATVASTANSAGAACTANFIISPKALTASMMPSIADRVYTGMAIEPEITVKDGSTTLVRDKDYTVTYSANIHVGTASVNISGIGNYTGTAIKTFEIIESDFEAGEGTEEFPYLISTKKHLDNVRKYPNAQYKLTADIVFTDEDFAEGGAFYNDGTGWLPIGSDSTPFAGLFDGNGYTIVGMRQNYSSSYGGIGRGGLFGYITYATIKNLGMVDSDVRVTKASGSAYAGSIAGYAVKSKITNCYNTGSVYAKSPNSAYAGGITGYTSLDSCISNCRNSGSISEADHVGGIVGYAECSVSNCRNEGNISKGRRAGGIVGYAASSSSISECYNAGTFSEITASVGGIVGYAECSISNCRNEGNIRGNSTSIGGIAGYASSCIDYCYNVGDIADATNTGGIVGNAKGSVSNCYNIGSISGSKYTGGIVGYGDYRTIISSCYNIGNVVATTSNTSYGAIVGYAYDNIIISSCYYLDNLDQGVGNGAEQALKRSLAAMQKQTTFSSFDFVDVWQMSDGSTYPLPTLRYTPHIEKPENTTEFAGGNGTATSPYLISTKEQLNNVRNHLDACFKMTADIVFTDADFAEGGAFYNDGVGWNAIGNSENTFTGCFDGNGYTITGLYMRRQHYTGLFGCMCGATVKNLGMIDPEIYATGIDAGSIAGRAAIGSKIDNCYNTGNIASSGEIIGGIVGYVADSKVSNCHNTGNIIGKTDAGGIVGGANSGSSISNCYNTGNVSGTEYVGGIAGSANASNCRNAGNISADDSRVGGIVGSGGAQNCHNSGSVSGKYDVGGVVGYGTDLVSYCYNTGFVSGNYQLGGIVGTLIMADIYYCYNTGNVDGGQAGGIVGHVSGASYAGGTIAHCYNTGNTRGGIIGSAFNWANIYACYNIGAVNYGIAFNSGTATLTDCYYLDNCSAGVNYGTDTATKCTREQMKLQSTFVGFDFDGIWEMGGEAYWPYPQLADMPMSGRVPEVQAELIGATITCRINSATDRTFSLMVAQYDTAGRMRALQNATVTLLAGTKQTKEFTFTALDGAKYKVFMTDSVGFSALDDCITLQ